MKRPNFRRGHGDPYGVLGVDTGASQQDITRAYRRAAQRVHPDTQPQDPQAAARFQALADAYDLLRDPRRRADYDDSLPADEPASPSAEPSRTTSSPRQPRLFSPTPGQPVWAGPVRVEPTAGAVPQRSGGDSAAAEFEDPPLVLDVRPSSVWGWPW